MKILILGYSKIVKKRVFNVFFKKKIKLFIATKSNKEKISGIVKKYRSYELAIKSCKPDLIYISLPNSEHFHWAKKSLNYNCHTIVDKPITINLSQLKNLIQISKKKKKLLAESTFFNYHSQVKSLKKIYNRKKFKNIFAKFIIPTPKKNSILLSQKLAGGVLMDMGPYISAIPRLFNLKKIINKKVFIKKNKKKLIISIKFLIKFKQGVYKGIFEFGGKYMNQIKIKKHKKTAIINRVFSPPDNENLLLILKNKIQSQKIQFKKENCFENFFNEIQNKIKNKQFDFYYKRMMDDCNFRSKLIM